MCSSGLKFFGRRQVPLANFRGRNFVSDLLIHALRRQRLAQLSLVTWLSAPLGFLAPIGFPWRLDDVARWRFRGVGRVFLGPRKLQLQLSNAPRLLL